MADTIEQMQAKVAAAIQEEFPEDKPAKPEKAEKPAREPAQEPAQQAPEETSDADDGDAAPAQKVRSEAEVKARERGWMPKDEWIAAGKDEDDWSSAKQFLKRGEEIEERKSMRKSFDSLKKQNEELAAILKKRLEAEAKKELAAKSKERNEAIAAGDVQRVHAIEQELVAAQPVEATPAEIQDFVRENKEWWGVDYLATQAAVSYYGKLEAENRDDITGNLAKTKKHLALRFPDLFPQDRKDAAEAAQAIVEQQTRKLSTVSVPSGAGAMRRGKQWSDIPSESRRVAEQIIRSGVMTREQYVKEFFGEV